MNAENSLITEKLKERIIDILESRHRKTGMNDTVSWRGIWIELGVPESEFCTALKAAAEERPRAAIVFTDSDHVRLNLKVRPANSVTHANAVRSKNDATEAPTTRVFRLFSGFPRAKTQQVETHQ